MKHSFTPAMPTEWLDISTVCRILQVSPAEVLALVESGVLSARGERISSSSLDAYSATKPLFGRPALRTFVRLGPGRFVEEI